MCDVCEETRREMGGGPRVPAPTFTVVNVCPRIATELTGEVVKAILDGCANLRCTVTVGELQRCLAMGKTYLARFTMNGQLVCEVEVVP